MNLINHLGGLIPQLNLNGTDCLKQQNYSVIKRVLSNVTRNYTSKKVALLNKKQMKSDEALVVVL